MRRPLIAGNWKMHGRSADLGEFATLAHALGESAARIDVLICPSAPLVGLASAAAQAISGGGPILVGAQDCSDIARDGPHTGEVNAAMLKDAGASFVIVGHSERRARWSETDALVRAKAEAAVGAGLTPIVCVGESDAARREGRALEVVWAQLAGSLPAKLKGADAPNIVVAYEPVWAVGTDRLPSAAEILDMHDAIRASLARHYGAQNALETRVLYGGSVNAGNAATVFAVEGVDGALVGRASLKAAEYAALIKAHPAA